MLFCSQGATVLHWVKRGIGCETMPNIFINYSSGDCSPCDFWNEGKTKTPIYQFIIQVWHSILSGQYNSLGSVYFKTFNPLGFGNNRADENNNNNEYNDDDDDDDDDDD